MEDVLDVYQRPYQSDKPVICMDELCKAQHNSSVTTTEIYARCNPELMRKQIEQVGNKVTESIEPYSEEEKETLIRWLKETI